MVIDRKAAPLLGQPTVANCTGIKETPCSVLTVNMVEMPHEATYIK
jgi:hypothetical protein